MDAHSRRQLSTTLGATLQVISNPKIGRDRDSLGNPKAGAQVPEDHGGRRIVRYGVLGEVCHRHSPQD
jgi:hypothetical protein